MAKIVVACPTTMKVTSSKSALPAASTPCYSAFLIRVSELVDFLQKTPIVFTNLFPSIEPLLTPLFIRTNFVDIT